MEKILTENPGRFVIVGFRNSIRLTAIFLSKGLPQELQNFGLVLE